MSEYKIIGPVSILTTMGVVHAGASFKEGCVSNKDLLKSLIEKKHIEKLKKGLKKNVKPEPIKEDVKYESLTEDK